MLSFLATRTAESSLGDDIWPSGVINSHRQDLEKINSVCGGEIPGSKSHRKRLSLFILVYTVSLPAPTPYGPPLDKDGTAQHSGGGFSFKPRPTQT